MSSSFESRGKVNPHVLVDQEARFAEKYRAKAERCVYKISLTIDIISPILLSTE